MQKTVINKKENPGTSSATPFFKKEKSSNFFDGGDSAFFKNSHATNVQRKCAHCEQEEKKQHKEENDEEEGKEIQRKPIFESSDENIVQRQPADPAVPPPVVPPIGTCPAYDANEVNKSRTSAGWLPQDVTEHSPDQLLFADFGNNHSFVKRSALSEAVWNSWKTTFQTDGSYRIQIAGFSDCSGDETVNTSIRHARALSVERTLGSRIAKKLSFRGMSALGQFVAGNDTPENRARNRSVTIRHKQGFFDQVEATENANEAGTAITTALAQLSSSPLPRERNVPAYVAQRGITVEPLTPRHEGTVVTPVIDFFPGTNYAATFSLPAPTRFHIHNTNANIAIQARNMPNIADLASTDQIKERIVQAVTQMAHLVAAGPVAAATTFEQYKAQFNAWWNVMPYRGMLPELDPALDSFGPRTSRAREIFKKIYAENSTIKDEYDRDTGDIKEKIDTYNSPDGFNRINSPRLQVLRDVFLANVAPISNPNYAAFKTAVEAASVPLDGDDRIEVANSNEWQRLINRYLEEDAKRTEIREVINSHHGAPAGPVAPPLAPAPSAGGGAAARAFLNHVHIKPPPSPINANQASEFVPLIPESDRPNPGLNVDTRFTITPAARVIGNSVTSDERWPAGKRSGIQADAEISNTGTVAMNAHLDLVNLPAGITAPVVPDVPFTVNDNRQANLLSSWTEQVEYSLPGGGTAWVSGGQPVRYVSGSQQFRISGWMIGSSNPGLALSCVSRLKKAGAVIDNNTAAPLPWPNNADHSTPILFSVIAPGVVPAAGDAYDVELDLVDTAGTVLATKTVSFNVLPEIVYTEADAIRSATEDNAHFHDNSATGLLGLMTAKGGLAARVATAVNTPNADGGITVLPLTARHDSAAYVASQPGGARPSKIGYFVGMNYAISFVDVVGAAGFHTTDYPALGNNVILLNRTHDVAANTKRSDDELIMLLTHEAVHALDERPDAGSFIERYKTEFRAYWMDGRYGPPDQATCPAGPVGTCYEAWFDPSLTPPGPKSWRARQIFLGLYNSPGTYAFVKEQYDKDADFRTQVDNYVYPDGINLLASVRIERLRAIIEAYGGADFATLQTQVKQYMGTAVPAPAGGALDNDEKAQIKNNRAWRDLVKRKVTVIADQLTLKGDLGIPVAP